MKNAIEQLESIRHDILRLVEAKKQLVNQNIALREKLDRLNKEDSKLKNTKEQNKNHNIAEGHSSSTKTTDKIDQQIDLLLKRIDKCLYLLDE